MKFGVMHVNSSTMGSTSPTMRIAKFVASELNNAPFIYNPETANKYLKTKFDILFVKHGLLRFSNHRDQALEIYNNAGMTVNLENDYTFELDNRFKPAEETWSTVEGKTRYINWNRLTRFPIDQWKKQMPWITPMNIGLFYYGAHRDDRVQSFRQYFQKAPYPVTISSFRGSAKFLETCGDVAVISAFRDPRIPAQWPLTIYIEDATSHKLYCSPAARFYECLQIGLAQVIDEATVPTFEKTGLALKKQFVVNSQRGVKSALEYWKDIRNDQRMLWYTDYGTDLRNQFWDAMKHSFNERRK